MFPEIKIVNMVVIFLIPIVVFGYKLNHLPENIISRTLIQSQIADEKQIVENFLILSKEVNESGQKDQMAVLDDCWKCLGNRTRVPKGPNRTTYSGLGYLKGKMMKSKKRSGKKISKEYEEKVVVSIHDNTSGKKREIANLSIEGKKKGSTVIKKGKKGKDAIKYKSEKIKGSKKKQYTTSLPTGALSVTMPSLTPSNLPPPQPSNQLGKIEINSRHNLLHAANLLCLLADESTTFGRDVDVENEQNFQRLIPHFTLHYKVDSLIEPGTIHYDELTDITCSFIHDYLHEYFTVGAIYKSTTLNFYRIQDVYSVEYELSTKWILGKAQLPDASNLHIIILRLFQEKQVIPYINHLHANLTVTNPFSSTVTVSMERSFPHTEIIDDGKDINNSLKSNSVESISKKVIVAASIAGFGGLSGFILIALYVRRRKKDTVYVRSIYLEQEEEPSAHSLLKIKTSPDKSHGLMDSEGIIKGPPLERE
jgi:hypothetical protein